MQEATPEYAHEANVHAESFIGKIALRLRASRGEKGKVVGMENNGYAYRLKLTTGLRVSKDVTTITEATMESVMKEQNGEESTYFPDVIMKEEPKPDPTMPTPAQGPQNPAPPTPEEVNATGLDDQVPFTFAPLPILAQEFNAVAALIPAAGERVLRDRPAVNYRGLAGKRQRTLMIFMTLLPKTSLERALKDPERGALWQAAIDKELNRFKELEVYEWVPEDQVPPNTKLLPHHMVLTEKYDDTTGGLTQVKVCCVARGDLQDMTHQYIETTSPTATPESFRLMLSRAVDSSDPMSFRFFDVSTAFLNAKLKPEE